MKKATFTLTLLLAVFSFLPLVAQNDTTRIDEIEVFSDTTSIDSTSAVVIPPSPLDDDFDFPGFDDDFFSDSHSLHNVLQDSVGGMIFVLAVLFIIFVLSPIVIIGLILWFIYKNRKNRMRLAEMAMQNGQPIPDELVKTTPDTNDEVRQKGIRQVFLGIGLTFLLGFVAGKIGAGIGVLVLCIGLGNLIISREAKEKDDKSLPGNFWNK